MQEVEAKIAVHADDMVYFLENTLVLLKELCRTIGHFGQISRYKISEDKSILCGFNISAQLKQSILDIMAALQLQI